MRRHSFRPQRTIRQAVEVAGVGFLTGATVRLRFVPAPPSSGVAFVRTDLPGKPRLAAHVCQVTGTQRRTTLGHPPIQVSLVEHVLASLAGLRIDNCLVELNAPEPPGLDGSAQGFVQALMQAGIQPQAEKRSIWGVEEPVTLRAGNASLTIYPPEGSGLKMTYFLDYGPRASIDQQEFTMAVHPGTFLSEVAWARTFLLESEALELRRQGLGARLTPADLLVFGARGPIGNRLRKGNEPARHKVLDMIGDLSLLGMDLCGHIIACHSGHPLNVELTRLLHHRLAGALRCAA